MKAGLEKELSKLLELAEKYGLSEASVAQGGERLEVKLDFEQVEQEKAWVTPETAQSSTQGDTIPETWVAIKSPLLGTFYRKPAPEAPPFVEEGDEVEPETTIGLVEAMKVFNEVAAEVSGKVRRIVAQDGSLVQPDDVLMWVERN